MDRNKSRITIANLMKSVKVKLAISNRKQGTPRQQLRHWCRRLANWTKHMRLLWFWPIPCIIWRHDAVH